MRLTVISMICSPTRKYSNLSQAPIWHRASYCNLSYLLFPLPVCTLTVARLQSGTTQAALTYPTFCSPYQGVSLLKPGGTLVYSTCTITMGENEEQVAWILNKYPCLQLHTQVPGLFVGLQSCYFTNYCEVTYFFGHLILCILWVVQSMNLISQWNSYSFK